IRATVTRMAATVTRRTTGMVRPTTAIAIRRTTATETGITSATTPDVTDERLPAPIKEPRKGNPLHFLSFPLLFPPPTPLHHLPPSPHSGLTFGNLITFPHASVSLPISWLNSPGDIVRTGRPRFSSRPLIFGSARAALTSRLSRSTIPLGVAAGAPSPDQPPPT